MVLESYLGERSTMEINKRIYELTEFGRLCCAKRAGRGGMTKFDMARAVGVTPSYVSQVEMGRIKPPESYICKVAATLGLTQAELRVALQASETQYLPDNVIPFGRPL